MNTLHVLGAILLLSITALNTQRHQMELRQQQIRSEIEMRATGVAGRLLDQLTTLDYDVNEDAGDPMLLTPASDFGGAPSFGEAVYVHDVHGLSFTATTSADGMPLEYEVNVTVQYLQPSNGDFVPSGSPTFFKEVTLQLTSQAGATLSVARVYTPHS